MLGALGLLSDSKNWEQHGSLTPDECAMLFKTTLDSFLLRESECNMIGSIIAYVTPITPPRMLPCDGGIYQKSDYPKLYNELIGTPLVIDSTTFHTPDLRGRFLRGVDGNNTENSIGGADEKSILVENIPEHDHTYQAVIFNVDVESVGIPDPVGAGIDPTPRHTSKAGEGVPFDVRPAYYSVRWGIIAK